MSDLSEVLRATGHWSAENEDGVQLGVGSCWAVGKDLVVTNLHVASMGCRATVAFESHAAMPVLGLVAVDRQRDLAIAKLRTGTLSLPVVAVSWDLPSIGGDIFVVGSPLGLRQSASKGIVSALRYAGDLAPFGIVGRESDRFIQIDAAISPGSSGGPIVDSTFSVVATSTFLIAAGQSLNFGVPAGYVFELLDLAGPCESLSRFAENRGLAAPDSDEDFLLDEEDEGLAAPTSDEDISENEKDDYFSRAESLSISENVWRLFEVVACGDGDCSTGTETWITTFIRGLGFEVEDWLTARSRLVQELDAVPEDVPSRYIAMGWGLDQVVAMESATCVIARLTAHQRQEILLGLEHVSALRMRPRCVDEWREALPVIRGVWGTAPPYERIGHAGPSQSLAQPVLDAAPTVPSPEDAAVDAEGMTFASGKDEEPTDDEDEFGLSDTDFGYELSRLLYLAALVDGPLSHAQVTNVGLDIAIWRIPRELARAALDDLRESPPEPEDWASEAAATASLLSCELDEDGKRTLLGTLRSLGKRGPQPSLTPEHAEVLAAVRQAWEDE